MRMSNKKIQKFNFPSKLHDKTMSIRTKVFIQEQNVDASIEIEYEEESTHYLLEYKGLPAATTRWRATDKGIKLERFACHSEYRGKGFGKDLLLKMLADVIGMKKKIYLHAQAPVIEFYKKFGFEEEGDHFWEADIEHALMVYKVKNSKELGLNVGAVCRR